MQPNISSPPYRRAFNAWLRTGLWVEVPEQKGKNNGGGNPNHDPDNGQFTFGPGGPRQSEPRRQLADIRPASGGKPPVQATAPKPAQPPKASPKNIAHGTNASIAQIEAEKDAVWAISKRLDKPGVSATAKATLEQFLDGTADPVGGTIFDIGSVGSNEVRNSDYGKGFNAHAQAKIAARNGGVIPDGDYLELRPDEVDKRADIENRVQRFEPYRSAGLGELIRSFGNDVTLMDVIGSFTMPVNVRVRNGIMTYRGVNKMGLSSFAAGNSRSQLGLGGGIVDAPAGSGKLGTTTQTVYFQFPVASHHKRKQK